MSAVGNGAGGTGSVDACVRDIGTLLTMDRPGDSEGIRDAAVLIRQGRIAWAGPARDLDPASVRGLPTVSAEGGLVTPGLVECHTHLVFAGNRAGEFEDRLSGRSYEEIAQAGGGILATVRATRQASDDELLRLAEERARDFLEQGVTTLEVKSGYGLDLEQELRLLRVIGRLGQRVPVTVVPTFLGAHAIPPEGRGDRAAWVRDLRDRWVPAVARQGIARFCDVFCESMAFLVGEAEEILQAGLQHGLRPKIHADQLSDCGGSALAARVGAVSADHLDRAPESSFPALARAGTVAVLLPGCMAALGRRDFPDARPLRRAGVRVALSTDFNPGTSPTRNLPLMGTFGMAWCGLTLWETWAALTIWAAAALGMEGEVGRVAPGMAADLVAFRGEDPRGPFYEYGTSRVSWVMRGGRLAFRRDAREGAGAPESPAVGRGEGDG